MLFAAYKTNVGRKMKRTGIAILCLGSFAFVGCRPSGPDIELTRPRESMIQRFRRMAKEDLSAQSPAFRARVAAQVSGICNIHHIQMERRWLPVIYGRKPPTGWPPESEQAARFPNSDFPFYAGDLGCPTKELEIYVCRECAAAFLEWTKSRPNQAPTPPTGAVTSRADARLTPTPVVAHL
jgi:hypothetical protein